MIYIFLTLCFIHLWCCYFEFVNVQRFTKILLMPLLLMYVCIQNQTDTQLIILALIFGFLGDIFLLFEKHPIYFLAGLGTFLLGHVFYIFELLKNMMHDTNISLSVGITLPLLLLGYIMYKTISSYLNRLKLPVIAYCITIMSMLGVASLYFITHVTFVSFLSFLGAISFVVSDYLLARSIFIGHFKRKDVWIMSSYLLAQLLLVLSLV